MLLLSLSAGAVAAQVAPRDTIVVSVKSDAGTPVAEAIVRIPQPGVTNPP
jgi:hypothetical protein